MITSGYLIGQIIDAFSSLGEQAKLRNVLGLSDLSVYSENFFRDILNIIEDLSLENTNEDRANEPGVDLGDKNKKIAFQVTATKTSAKVKKTLLNITEEQRNKYSKFIVLIIGEKQQTYEAVDNALSDRTLSGIHTSISFDPQKDIIDLNDLARKVIGLPLPKIQRLHKFIHEQLAQVKIELQVPDKDGNYETSSNKLWEPLPKPNLGDGSKFAAWDKLQESGKEDPPSQERIDDMQKAIQELSKRLNKLPRITREFFATLHERSEDMNHRFTEYRSLFVDYVNKTYPNAQVELNLLKVNNLIDINNDPLSIDENIPGEIGLKMWLGNEGFSIGFYGYVIKKGLSFQKILGELDFSEF